MKVALDLEDVLVETMDLFMEELNRFLDEKHPEVNRKLERSNVAKWAFQDIREDFGDIRGWKQNHEEKFLNGDSKDWEGFLPMTGRIWKEEPQRYAATTSKLHETVRDIREVVEENEGTLDIVTARINGGKGVKKRLDQLDLLQYIDSVVLERNKETLDYDVYIDDYPYLHRNLENAVQVMVNQPWNKAEDLNDPHVRVETIEESPEVIRDLG